LGSSGPAAFEAVAAVVAVAAGLAAFDPSVASLPLQAILGISSGFLSRDEKNLMSQGNREDLMKQEK
jgi:hypothetical protein